MSAWVQALDQYLYRDPQYNGVDWYVTFEEEDDMRIIVRRFKNTSCDSARRRAATVLKSQGFSCSFRKGFAEQGKRYLVTGNSKKGKMQEAFIFPLVLHACVPTPKDGCYTCRVKTLRWDSPDRSYIFTMEFTIDDIEVIFSEAPLSKMTSTRLFAWLWDISIYENPEPYRERTRKLILEQYPGLAGLNGTVTLIRKLPYGE